jgi:hypothetical protein
MKNMKNIKNTKKEYVKASELASAEVLRNLKNGYFKGTFNNFRKENRPEYIQLKEYLLELQDKLYNYGDKTALTSEFLDVVEGAVKILSTPANVEKYQQLKQESKTQLKKILVNALMTASSESRVRDKEYGTKLVYVNTRLVSITKFIRAIDLGMNKRVEA